MALQAPAIPVEFGFVFPAGAYAESAEPVADFEASKGRADKVQVRDKLSGHPVWVVHVYDPDPQARTKSTKVKIVFLVAPTLPEPPADSPFRPVEFEGLTVTPYVTDKGRLGYSLRARAVRPASASAARHTRSAPAA